jgi:hypothetical protein
MRCTNRINRLDRTVRSKRSLLGPIDNEKTKPCAFLHKALKKFICNLKYYAM